MQPKLIILLSLASIALGASSYDEEKYYRTPTPPPPRILSHKQAQGHDGGFKFAFAAENGLAQTEVIAPDGSRNGGYTYVDPHGKTITVKYTAGKEGFRIIEGDHIHREVALQSHYAPQPHHTSASGPPDDGSYNPEKYEHPYQAPEDREKDERPAYRPQPTQEYHHKPSAYQLDTAPQQYKFERPQYQEQKVVYKPQYLQPQPQPHQQYYKVPIVLQAQPRHYAPAPALHDAPLSNAVDDGHDDYHSNGKPHNYGVGYSFHFQN